MSIRNKIVAILLLCLAAMAASVSFAVRFYATRQAETEFARQAVAQLDRLDDLVRVSFKTAEQGARTLASLPEVKQMAQNRGAESAEETPAPDGEPSPGSEEALPLRLDALRAVIPGVEAVFCGFRNGAFHAYPPEAAPGGHDARAQSWYSDTAWGLADVSVTGAAISETSKSLTATVAARIKGENGETVGVAALVVSLAGLTDTLRVLRLGESGFVVLFDPDGRVLFDPHAQENLLRPADEAGEPLASLLRLSPGRHVLTAGDESLAAYSRILEGSRWKAVLVMDRAEELAPGSRMANAVAVAAGIAALILALAGTALAFMTTRPLYALIRQSRALADGNAEALAGIPGRGPDITSLQNSIGQLTGRILLLTQAEKNHALAMQASERQTVAASREHMDRLARDAYHAASRNAARAMAPAAADAAAGAAGLNDWAAKVHSLARTQALAANNVRTATLAAMEEMAILARQAAETEKSAEDAHLTAQKTGKLLLDHARAATALEQGSQALLPGLDAFKAGTARIAGLALSARDIAEEVNVLGLKLAIEVSGAGESGKSFMPMTEEMRTLAEKMMAVAGGMEDAVASFDQSHASHARDIGKNDTAVKRVVAGAAKMDSAVGRTMAVTGTVIEQIRVLATALEGMAQTGALEPESAEAVLRAARDTAGTLKQLDGVVTGFDSLAARLGSLAAALEAPPDEDELFLALADDAREEQKPLD